MNQPLPSPILNWSRACFFFTAFTAGAVVMALEILGSRLLAPIFGSSLFVWGALIGVILAAMSTGYATGGWLADRRSPGTVLACLLLGSGTWTLLLAGAGQPVVFTVSQWIHDPRWGPCLAAGVLLAVPAFGLSGVLPALLRLAIADMGHLGRHTGGMIAVSTIGSLIGTWGTSFYLLTWLGSVTVVAVLGVVQVMFGVLWWRWAIKVRTLHLAPVVGGFVLLGWFAFHPITVLPPGVYAEDSPYQQVRVRENDLFRYLVLDNTFHAIMWKVDPVQLALPYSQMMMAALSLPSDIQRGLILGQGGGSLAKWLARYWPSLELDIVEMDPSVVKAAEDFFDYDAPSNHHVYVQDARSYLRTIKEKYDIIWVDVFARHLIPFHLTTKEFYIDLREHLNPKGVLTVNLASSTGELDQKRAEAIVATIKTSFPHLTSFNVKGPPWLPTKPGSANLIFFASMEPIDIQSVEFREKVQTLVLKGKIPAEVQTLLTTSPIEHWKPGLILTDDFSPLDILQGSG